MKRIYFLILSLTLKGCIHKKIQKTYGPFVCDSVKQLTVKEDYEFNRLAGVNRNYKATFYFDQKIIAENSSGNEKVEDSLLQSSFVSIDYSQIVDVQKKPYTALDIISTEQKNAEELAKCLIKNQTLLYSQFPEEASRTFDRIVVLKAGAKLPEFQTTEL